MSSIYLSIGIPTLNGERFIEQALQSVIAQLPASAPVEIVVLDNASADETGCIVKDLAKSHPQIRYVRNHETVALSSSMREIAYAATGEYLWFLADDDVLTPGALATVLCALNSHEPVVLLTGFQDVDEALYPIGNAPAQQRNQVVYHDADDALVHCHFRFGLISAIVTRRLDFLAESLSVPTLPTPDHFLYIIPAEMRRGTTVVLPGVQVLFRKYPKRWVTRDDYHQTIENYYIVIPQVLRLLHVAGFNISTIRRMERRNASLFFFHVLVAKAKGLRFNRKLNQRLMAINHGNALFWLQTPVLLIPGFVPRAARALRRRHQARTAPASQ